MHLAPLVHTFSTCNNCEVHHGCNNRSVNREPLEVSHAQTSYIRNAAYNQFVLVTDVVIINFALTLLFKVLSMSRTILTTGATGKQGGLAMTV